MRRLRFGMGLGGKEGGKRGRESRWVGDEG